MLNCNSLKLYKRFLPFWENLLFQQFLVDYSAYEPDCETRNHCGAKGHIFFETDQCGDIKKNARNNPPDGTGRIFLHQSVVTRIVAPEPNQNNQTCQRHCGDKSSRRGIFFPDMDTNEYNADRCRKL